jgi:hypothetical protein
LEDEAMDKKLFDLSVTVKIPDPTGDFELFLNQFFLIPMIFSRREHDCSVLDRLHGLEKETARELIRVNLRTGYEHLIDAASFLQMREVIPTLQEMLCQTRDLASRITLLRTLQRFGVVEATELMAALREGIQKGSDFLCGDIFAVAFQMNDYPLLAELIRIGIRREDYNVRCTAYSALVDLEYMKDKTGTTTEELLASARMARWDRYLYPEYQRYIGQELFKNSADFHQGLMELDWRLSACKPH